MKMDDRSYMNYYLLGITTILFRRFKCCCGTST